MFHAGIRRIVVCLWPLAAMAQESGVPKGLSEAKGWTELVYQYGPFGFAILFAAVALWLIRGARKAAGSNDKEVEAQARNYWIGAAVAGCAFIGFASVGTMHWLRVAESVHVFRGEIKNLTAYEQVAGDELYFRTELQTVLQGETDPPLHNLHFIAIQDRPFTPGQLFDLAYLKEGASKRTVLRVAYQDGAEPVYRIEYNEQAQVSELKQVQTLATAAQPEHHAASPFAAYARSLPILGLQAASARVQPPAVQVPAGVDMRLVDLLQDSRTPVGAKIDALDRLRALDAASLKAYAETVTQSEPFALTLIELSRHSDRELASKARALADKAGVDRILATQLNSSKAHVRSEAQQAVFRVAPERAEAILQQAPATPQTRKLATEVREGSRQRVLTPVGSAGGDRYYVKASWDPHNRQAVECLSGLFNRELVSTRSLGDERKLMAGRSQRLVYGYTKDWALNIADQIEACSATASFPTLSAKKK
jgi:hypothetical protein